MTRSTRNSPSAKRSRMPAPAAIATPPERPRDSGSPSNEAGPAPDATSTLLQTPLAAILDSLPEAAFLFASDASIVRVNAAARNILALDADPTFAALPVRGRLARLVARDLQGRPIPIDEWHMMRVLRGETISSDGPFESCITALDGRELTLSFTAAPIHDAGGAIIGALSLARDITQQRRVEREAAARANQMITALESMTDGVVVMGYADGQWHLRYMNAANYAMFGLENMDLRSVKIVLSDDAGHILPENEWPFRRILRGETLRGGNAFDMVIAAPVERRIQVSVSGAPIRDEAGDIVGCVLVHRDVTERRRLERRTQEALEALLTLAELVVVGDVSDTAPAADVDALAAQVVQATAQVLGCSRVALVAMREPNGAMEPLAVLGLSPEEERIWQAGEPKGAFLRDGMPPWLQEQLESGEAVVLDYSQPPLRERANPLGLKKVLFVALRQGDEVVGMLNADYGAATHEYTPDELRLAEAVAKLLGLVIERARLLRERAEARGKALALEETNRRMDEFLGIASHELKTPVTVIKANLQMLARQPRTQNTEPRTEPRPELEAHMVARALEHVDRLTRLVNDLLDVSRVREGKLEFRPEPCDLATVVKDAVEGQRQAHPQRRIALMIDPRPILMVADADRIGQVVTNYLTNALKYSREGTPVDVSLRRERDCAVVEVRDRGVGIPREELEHVWEPFRRAAGIDVQSGSGVGLGLGLYICRTIVERHGGQVSATSTVGHGSTFAFTLPLSRPES